MQGEEGPQGPPGEAGDKGDKVGDSLGVCPLEFIIKAVTLGKKIRNISQDLNGDSDPNVHCEYTDWFGSAGQPWYPGPTGSGWQKGGECE